jgi:hypothetical protein
MVAVRLKIPVVFVMGAVTPGPDTSVYDSVFAIGLVAVIVIGLPAHTGPLLITVGGGGPAMIITL